MKEPSDLLDTKFAHELRIGNYYQYLHEEHETYHKADIDFIKTQLDYETNPDADEFSRGWWAAPIELSPEILEKCFKDKYTFQYTNASSCWVSIDNFIIRFECFSKGEVYYMVNQMQMKKMSYVHEFQNLIYSLTGTELTITL